MNTGLHPAQYKPTATPADETTTKNVFGFALILAITRAGRFFKYDNHLTSKGMRVRSASTQSISIILYVLLDFWIAP